MDIEALIKKLFDAKHSDGDGGYSWHIISGSKDQDIIETIIRLWASKQESTITKAEYERQIGTLQAKVFAYEELIKKSTFSPFIATTNKGDKPRTNFDRVTENIETLATFVANRSPIQEFEEEKRQCMEWLQQEADYE